MRAWGNIAAAAVALASLAAVPASSAYAQAKQKPAGAVEYEARYNTECAVCHGANGRSDMPGVPVLAGQPSRYVITQLFLFREGRHKNEVMVALASQMKDADLKGFSSYIGTLAPVPAPAPETPLDAERMKKGEALAQQHKCMFCHGANLEGGQQVPRIGGQKEDYVSKTLHGFKSGERPAYTRAMIDALNQVPVEDLDELAYFVAHFTGK